MKTNRTDNWEDAELDAGRVTPYVQTDAEYDQVLARAQLAAVNNRVEDQSNSRICGPSGCGKTTLAMSVAVDVACVNHLVSTHDFLIHEMDMDELAMLHHIVAENNDGLSGYREALEEHDSATNYNDEHNIDWPHSRGEAYRDLYLSVEGEPLPSVPFFDVTLSHATNAADLLGHPDIQQDGSTQWVDGKVTKAVRASKQGPTVLLLDEVNRAPTNAKDELYDALDGRVQVSLDGGRGGETIVGDPSNLIILSTMNKGPGHVVEPLDFAEKRRLGPMYETDFLGKNFAEQEKELIVENTPAEYPLASEMVKTANSLRMTASKDETNLSYGVPTGSLLEWAHQAYANHLAGVERSVAEAGISSVARAIFDHDEDEVATVENTISKDFGDISFDTADDEGWSGTRYVCIDQMDKDCSWSAKEEDASYEAKEFLICPECEGNLDTR